MNDFIKYKNGLNILAITLIVISCSKNPPIEPEPTEPVMPPLTHEGRNTFGCYIDGELFVANEGESVWSIPPVSGSFDEETKYLAIQGRRYIDFETNEREDIVLLAYITDGIGEYEFYYNDEGKTPGFINWIGERCDYYYQDIPDLGKLTITYLDETKNIISGTFYMNLTNEDCPEKPTLKITEGRFDFRY